MRDTFLTSGRVSFHPMSAVLGEPGSGSYAIRSLLSGETQTVDVRKRLVDATMTQTAIPLTHTRKFTVAEGVTCVPPNDLTRLAPGWKHFTVLGAGKTAIDSVLCLLAHGASPETITWVLPRDPWLINRATMQPGLAHFEKAIGSMARQFEVFAKAGSVRELRLQMEAIGRWMRLDPNVWPTMFHAATVTERELQKLHAIKDMVRLGHVKHIGTQRMQLQRGEQPSHPDTLYVDCTARALAARSAQEDAAQPVFEDALLRLQMVRLYQPTFSAALIAHIEATMDDDNAKRQLCRPTRMTDTVEDYLEVMAVTMRNQTAWNRRAAAPQLDPHLPAGHVWPDPGAGGERRRAATRGAGAAGGRLRAGGGEPGALDQHQHLTSFSARSPWPAWGCRNEGRVALLRRPAPVHRPGHAAHVVGRRAAQEHGQVAQLFRCGELQ
jgi:hypothetical protein